MSDLASVSTYAKEYATKLHFEGSEASPRLTASDSNVRRCAGACRARAQVRDVTTVFKMAAWNSRAGVPTTE